MLPVIERFVGRYEVWRRSVPLRNPLNLPAAVLAIGIARGLYQIATSHHITWVGAVLLAVDIVFLALFVSRSPWAWLVWPVWGTMTLIGFFTFISSFRRYPSRVSVVATVFLLLIGLGFIAWGFAIRRRYYAYIGYAPEQPHEHLTNR